MNKTHPICKLSNITIIGKHNNITVTFKDLSNMSHHSLLQSFSINNNGQTTMIKSSVINKMVYEYYETHFLDTKTTTQKEKNNIFGTFMTETVPKHIENWTFYNILYWGNVALRLNKTIKPA